jgi:hypothetical protein
MALSACIYREASSRAGAGDHVSEVREYEPGDGGQRPNFPLKTTQEGLLEALESLGKYEWLVIRMSLAFLSSN